MNRPDATSVSSPDSVGTAPIDLATYILEGGASSDIDVLIIGSGYGGAMALHELAGWRRSDGKPLHIVMLERGEWYKPGDFPRQFADMAGHVRFSGMGQAAWRGRAHGLFDVRVGSDVNVLLANGLGGGSLINAGVMLAPLPHVLQQPPWPQAIMADQHLFSVRFPEVKALLQTTSSMPLGARATAMSAFGPASACEPVPITIRMPRDAGHPAAGECIACGDCFIGCNHGAKLSLDVTLLHQAQARHPSTALKIVTGATVLGLRASHAEQADTSWYIEVSHTRLPTSQQAPHTLKAARVILAAGSLGSTEILLKSVGHLPGLGRAALGSRFSSNGDGLAIAHGLPMAAHGVADPQTSPAHRHAAPTISRQIDGRQSPVPMVVQDLGVPAPFRQVFEELAHALSAVNSLADSDCSLHKEGSADDPARIDPGKTERSLMVAVIGHDDAKGRLCLREPTPNPSDGDGYLTVAWPELRQDPRFAQRHTQIAQYMQQHAPGTTLLRNPVHRPLPPALEQVFGEFRGPLTTVHPLGGCPMGDDGTHGVVNHLGQVFMGADTRVYQHLLVLDGAMVPTSLGINPALTIATLSHRAMAAMRQAWGLLAPDPSSAVLATQETAYPDMPATPPAPTPDSTLAPTQVQMSELFWGVVDMDHMGTPTPHLVELELWFQPIRVDALTRKPQRNDGGETRTQLILDESLSELRIARLNGSYPQAYASDERPKGLVLLKASLGGRMSWLTLQHSRPLGRAVSSLPAWWLNRGLSDTVKHILDQWDKPPRAVAASSMTGGPLKDMLSRASAALKLSTHAGQRREMDYRLHIVGIKGPVRMQNDSAWGHQAWAGRFIHLNKPLAYGRKASPARQLMQAQVLDFPGIRIPTSGTALTFRLDPDFWRRARLPLMRLTHQANQPQALLDMFSLLMFVCRALLPIHMWSLRLPDRPVSVARSDQRLPGKLPDLPAPKIDDVDILSQTRPSKIRLTRYRLHEGGQPVLLIHGYSASGTTFAHPLLPEGGLAASLCRQGMDVWVLDLRTSAGMATAQQAWTFEEMATQDIPEAIQTILRSTPGKKIDVVAHCMGGAMLALGLSKASEQSPRPDWVQNLRRVVFSQVGPTMQMSPANTARAFITQWLRHYLQLGPYTLTPENPQAADDMLDRLLSLVPYPATDFDRENPWMPPWRRTPWVGTRHRMDFYYGVTFKLTHMSDAVLANIDHFFGPLHLATLAEVLHYARTRFVTDTQGYVMASPESMRLAMQSVDSILSLHSQDNQLVSPVSATYMADLFRRAGINHRQVILAGMGHQDSLIGIHAPQTYRVILSFLTEVHHDNANA